MTHSLFTLSDMESVRIEGRSTIHTPQYVIVRATDGHSYQRDVARIEIGEHGGVTVSVAEGVVVASLDEVTS